MDFLTLTFSMLGGIATASHSLEGDARIAIHWTDYELLTRKLSPGAREALETEVRSIFGEAGVEVLFHVGAPEDPGRRGPSTIRVILMPRGGEGWNLRDGAMGAILERVPRRGTVYIFVPVVERAIGISAASQEMIHDGRKAHALARALARVVAHETVHAIDSEIPHAEDGSVMSGNLTSELLLAPNLSFDGPTRKRVLETLLSQAGQNPGAAPRR